MHVLRADLDALRSAERFHHFRNRGKRRNNDDLDVSDITKIEKQGLNETLGFSLRTAVRTIRSRPAVCSVRTVRPEAVMA